MIFEWTNAAEVAATSTIQVEFYPTPTNFVVFNSGDVTTKPDIVET
jgi:hypothetical protein